MLAQQHLELTAQALDWTTELVGEGLQLTEAQQDASHVVTKVTNLLQQLEQHNVAAVEYDGSTADYKVAQLMKQVGSSEIYAIQHDGLTLYVDIDRIPSI